MDTSSQIVELGTASEVTQLSPTPTAHFDNLAHTLYQPTEE
jgi:hypothetical protein